MLLKILHPEGGEHLTAACVQIYIWIAKFVSAATFRKLDSPEAYHQLIKSAYSLCRLKNTLNEA